MDSIVYIRADAANAIIIVPSINSYAVDSNYPGRTGYNARSRANDIGGEFLDCSSPQLKCAKIGRGGAPLTWPRSETLVSTWRSDGWSYVVEYSNDKRSHWLVSAKTDEDKSYLVTYFIKADVGITSISWTNGLDGSAQTYFLAGPIGLLK